MNLLNTFINKIIVLIFQIAAQKQRRVLTKNSQGRKHFVSIDKKRQEASKCLQKR